MNLTKGIFIRLTDADYNYLEDLALDDPLARHKNGSLNLSAFCRERLLANANKKNVALQRSIDALSYQVRRIGNNINQIARATNAGYGRADDLDKIINNYAQLESSIDKYMQEVEALWELQN